MLLFRIYDVKRYLEAKFVIENALVIYYDKSLSQYLFYYNYQGLFLCLGQAG